MYLKKVLIDKSEYKNIVSDDRRCKFGADEHLQLLNKIMFFVKKRMVHNIISVILCTLIQCV